jgi:restriction system protein
MKKIDFNDIVSQVTEVSNNRKYWFFRTNGGDYYWPFVDGGYIAIGYNKISYATLKEKKKDTGQQIGIKELSDLVREQYKEKERHPNLAASQLLKFVNEISSGDIVLIPSVCSQEISVGEVVDSKAYEITDEKTGDGCPYTKRKKVIWLKTISRDALDPTLYKLMFSRHIISNANSYDGQIDRLLYDFYIKNGVAYLILDVATRKDINARELFELGTAMLDIVDGYKDAEGLDIDTSTINIKLNVQSPGIISLSGAILGLTVLGVILIFVAGGKFTIKSKKIDSEVTFETPGLIDQLRKYMTAKGERQDRKKIIDKSMKDLSIKSPKELRKIIQTLLDKNNDQ